MIARLLGEFFQRFSTFRKVAPVDSTEAFCDFLATRAAFVSQKKLYEYVKTRMGLNYPRAFREDTFIASLNIAKWHVYAACLSDLGLWMAAQLHARSGDGDEVRALASHAFARSVHERFDASQYTGEMDGLVADFEARLRLADLHAMAEGESAFSLSPKALVQWAPISDELKKFDVDIVLNSLRFAWLAIRQQFRDALVADRILSDWRRRSGSGPVESGTAPGDPRS